MGLRVAPPGSTTAPHVEKLRLEYEAEYTKMNTAELDLIPTEKLVQIQAQHFKTATQKIAESNLLLKHVGAISGILLKRNLERKS